jgi:short-subunit dehydrogenase
MTHHCALITGATSGIGAAFADVLPSDTSLLLTGRRADRLAADGSRLRRDGRRVETVVADLASCSGRQKVIDCALGVEVDLVICNAGLGRFGAFARAPFADIEEQVVVNVLAHLQIVHALLPRMCSEADRTGRRAGLIIVSSTASFQPGPTMATYAAGKAFLLHFGESLAAELRDMPIDVVTVCPSFTRTEFFARASLPPPPSYSSSPDAVAREALTALGARTVDICGGRLPGLRFIATRNPGLAQSIKLLFARNPALRAWQWPRAAFSHRPRTARAVPEKGGAARPV